MPPKDKTAMQWKVEQKPDRNSCDQLGESIVDTELIGQQVNPQAIERQATDRNRSVTKGLSVNRVVPGGKAPMPSEKKIRQGSEKSTYCRRRDVPNATDLDQEYQ